MKLFSNIEYKLSSLASFVFICGILFAICFALSCVLLHLPLWFIIIIICCPLIILQHLIIAWFIYGFAELIANVQDINDTLENQYADQEQHPDAEAIFDEEE